MPAPELMAPERWACIDFISDLHLQADDPATVAAWRDYLRGSPADALFILGDLFEVWVGDDALATTGAADNFEASSAACSCCMATAIFCWAQPLPRPPG